MSHQTKNIFNYSFFLILSRLVKNHFPGINPELWGHQKWRTFNILMSNANVFFFLSSMNNPKEFLNPMWVFASNCHVILDFFDSFFFKLEYTMLSLSSWKNWTPTTSKDPQIIFSIIKLIWCVSIMMNLFVFSVIMTNIWNIL